MPAAFLLAAVAAVLGGPGAAWGQGLDLANRPIADIRVEGVKQVKPQLVLNQVRLNKGEAYAPKTVQEDIVRITHLGRFSSVQAKVEPRPDGSVVLTYVVVEQPLLSDVQVVGNKAISDEELLKLAVLRAGDAVDQFLIDRGAKQIKQAYEKEGYFLADVTADQDQLKESSILLYRVREGPMVRIRKIRFEGHKAFTDSELKSKIRSETYLAILITLRKGELSREHLEADAARVRDFYRERGYLDAQVGRRIDASPDQKDAVVVFLVSEGRRYTVANVRVEGNRLFSAEQVLQRMPLKVGDVFSMDRLKKSQEAVTDLYGKLGYIETQVGIERLFHENAPMVDLAVKIDEGRSYLVGKVSVTGNQLTQDKVVYHQVRGMQPGRPFDRSGIQLTEQRLKESPWFGQADVTILGDSGDATRDVLIEVKEKQTGSLGFGAGISSDLGVVGGINLQQKNFDVADWPESFEEFFSGRAFRGAGQSFGLTLEPGNEYSTYQVSFREPYLLDSQYFFDTTAFYLQRVRQDYDENRSGGSVGIGQQFGDVWRAGIRMRGENVVLDNVAAEAPEDVWDVKGHSVLTSLGLVATRSTTDSQLFPTRGSRTELKLTRYGALGGDYDFTSAGVEFRNFWTLDEDFYGRRTVLSLRVETGYIFEDGEAPIFERLYAGGARSFRGFEYRGVGPRGVRHDNGRLGDTAVGGNWLFLVGVEYNYPIYQDVVRQVFFVDTGTLREDFGFGQYRVSVGTGFRLRLPFLTGPVPLAIDFAWPVVKQSTDEERFWSFDIALPFR